MTILFIDSDIILDILLERQPFFGASAELLENEKFQCFTSVHSILNVHYFTKKKFGELVTECLATITSKTKNRIRRFESYWTGLNIRFLRF
jgi:hypothetical protein